MYIIIIIKKSGVGGGVVEGRRRGLGGGGGGGGRVESLQNAEALTFKRLTTNLIPARQIRRNPRQGRARNARRML